MKSRRIEINSTRNTAAAATELPLPFRWDISRRERLGRILEDDSACRVLDDPGIRPVPTVYHGFLDDLVACAAQVTARAGDADLVFVGRSPDSLFDILSGLLNRTSRREHLSQLQFSAGCTEADVQRLTDPDALRVFRAYLDTLGLSPSRLIVRERPVAFIDLICNGRTMGRLLRLIYDWTVEQNADWPAVRLKLRVVGITSRNDQRPPLPLWRRRRAGVTKQYDWRADALWIDELLESGALRQVSAPSRLWVFLGELQPKARPSFRPERWGTYEASCPSHEAYCIHGVRAARKLYEAGCAPETRARFAELLAADELAMRDASCRRLVQEIRKR